MRTYLLSISLLGLLSLGCSGGASVRDKACSTACEEAQERCAKKCPDGVGSKACTQACDKAERRCNKECAK